MIVNVYLGAALAVCLSSSVRQAQQDIEEPPRFELKDVFELEYASDPRISPDGREVVYARRFMDIMNDRVRSNLWIVQSDGSDQRPLTSGNRNDSSARWSPDGKRLLYASSVDGSPQLYVRWMDSGQTAQISHLTSGAGNLGWSPDGKWISFTSFVEESIEPLANMPAQPEGASWAPAAKVITAAKYRADGAGYLKQGRTHLFVLPAEGGSPRQLTHGDFDVSGLPRWSPDGLTLYFSANLREDAEDHPLDSEICSVPFDGGPPEPLTDRYGPDSSPILSPDGESIVYFGFDDRHQGYQVTKLYLMGRDGQNSRCITTGLDRSISAAQWTADGKGLVFSYADQGNSRIAYLSLAEGSIRPLASNMGGTSLGRPYASGSFTISREGRVAYTYSTPSRPADVAILDRGASQPKLVTQLNEDLLGHKQLATLQPLRFASSLDQLPLQGWIMRPPGFEEGQRYPLLLEIHGGPFADYGDRFTTEGQLYAAAGYVVFYMNPRGSTSYGEEFGNRIHHSYPGKDYTDLMDGVDAMLARGYVDPDQLYVTGGSGGGVLTAWIVGKTDRFRAAVVAKPVINWTSFALTSDATSFFTRYWFAGTPWDEQDNYWKRSPLSLVGNVSTPTMLLSGEADFRTPISEAEQFYQALKLRHIETALVRIPEASHGITARPSHQIAKVAHILAWFEKFSGSQEDE